MDKCWQADSCATSGQFPWLVMDLNEQSYVGRLEIMVPASSAAPARVTVQVHPPRERRRRNRLPLASDDQRQGSPHLCWCLQVESGSDFVSLGTFDVKAISQLQSCEFPARSAQRWKLTFHQGEEPVAVCHLKLCRPSLQEVQQPAQVPSSSLQLQPASCAARALPLLPDQPPAASQRQSHAETSCRAWWGESSGCPFLPPGGT